MEVAPTLTAAVSAQRELTLHQLGINTRQAIQVAEVRALDRLLESASYAPAKSTTSVPAHPTRGRKLDIRV